jgi:hypothetical protein
MSRFKQLTIVMLMCAMFGFAPAVFAAQDDPQDQDPPIDLATLRASLLEIGQDEQATQDLAAELVELPLVSTNLPAGFVEAEHVDPTQPLPPETTRGQQGVLSFEELGALPEIKANVAFTVLGDPAVLGGDGSTNSLTYVIFDPMELADDAITGDTLDQIEEGIEEAFDATTTGGVKLVSIAEIDDDDDQTLLETLNGRLVTYTLADGTTNAAAQLYIVPIENVFVFSLVTIAANGPLNQDDVVAPAENLTMAGIEHLEDAVSTLRIR